MMAKEIEASWEEEYQQVMEEMVVWRKANPRATFSQIEQTLDERLNRLRAKMLEDTVGIGQEEIEAQMICPDCGQAVRGRGKRSVACKLKGAKVSPWSGNTLSAPSAAGRFSPLDEILELLPGQLAPSEQEKLIRLGGWLSFEPAAQLFTVFTGIAVSKSSCRRLTEKGGQVLVNDQEAAVQAMEAGELVTPDRVVEQLVFSTDGCMVPLVGGKWAEVRTLVIGEVGMAETTGRRAWSFWLPARCIRFSAGR